MGWMTRGNIDCESHRHDQIDRPGEERLQHGEQPEIGIGMLALDEWLEIDEEIEVALAWVESIGGGRAEKL